MYAPRHIAGEAFGNLLLAEQTADQAQFPDRRDLGNRRQAHALHQRLAPGRDAAAAHGQRQVAGYRPGESLRTQALDQRHDAGRIVATLRGFCGGNSQQGEPAGGVGAVEDEGAIGMAALRCRFGRLDRAGHGARHAQVNQGRMVRQQEFELPAEIARRRLAGSRQYDFLAQFPVELGRRQSDLVQVVLVAEVQAQRHDVDVELFGNAVRQVGGAIGDDGDAAATRCGARLRAHVVGLGGFDPAETRRSVEQGLRIGHVRMQADARMRARDYHAGRTQVADGRTQAGAVEALAQQQAFAAPAVRGIGIENFLVRLRSFQVSVGFGFEGLGIDLAVAEVVADALQQIDKPLRTGIHHAGTFQDRQLLRRVRQRTPRSFECGCKPATHVIHPSVRVERFGKRADDAEDGAFARLGQGLSRRQGTGPDSASHRAGLDGGAVAEALGHAGEKLRQDRARISARAVDGVFADPAHQFAGPGNAPAQRASQHTAQGEGEIAAGIAVGHREDIDLVEYIAVGDDPARAGNQGAAQGGAADAQAGSLQGNGIHRREVCRMPRQGPCCAASCPCESRRFQLHLAHATICPLGASDLA